MVMARSALRRATRASRSLKSRVEESPNRYVRWLPGQLAFLKDPSQKKMARWGNQWGGKTTAGLTEINWRCLGSHPYLRVPKGPIEAWIICASWSQSVSIQEKFWQTVDRRDLVPGTTFSKKNGFNAKTPMVEYRNGSVVRFKTTQQGALDLAGASIDVALFDEPPKNERTYSEVVKRVLKKGRNGAILLTLTPINAPCEWLKKLVDEGSINDNHFRMEPQFLIPVGHTDPIRLEDGTVCDADWIAEVIRDTLPHEVPVVCHGEWEMRVKGNIFRAFRHQGEGSHVIQELEAETSTGLAWGKVAGEQATRSSYRYRLGIDHGSGLSYSAVAVLIGVRYDTEGKPVEICVVDEYVSDGETTEDQDAEALADLLIRNGVKWGDLEKAYGDRPWAAKKARRINQKSNAKLMKALHRLPGELRKKAGIPSSNLSPTIETVKRGEGHGAGSVHYGTEYLHKAMVRDGFYVHERCERGILSLTKWDGPATSEWKHWIDALRYGLDDLIFDRRLPVGVRSFAFH